MRGEPGLAMELEGLLRGVAGGLSWGAATALQRLPLGAARDGSVAVATVAGAVAAAAAAAAAVVVAAVAVAAVDKPSLWWARGGDVAVDVADCCGADHTGSRQK